MTDEQDQAAGCEWTDDLPGEPCGTDDAPAPATTRREIFWSSRLWGGEGEDWTETTALCESHAKAYDEACAKRYPPAPPKVYNKRHGGAPPDAVYVGRPTKWGNPFTHLPGVSKAHRVATRQDAIDEYRHWLLARPDLVEAARQELRGKDLICWCAPLPCHADVLIGVANA